MDQMAEAPCRRRSSQKKISIKSCVPDVVCPFLQKTGNQGGMLATIFEGAQSFFYVREQVAASIKSRRRYRSP